MKRLQRPRRIELGSIVLENLTDLRPEGAYLKAVTEVLGVSHHVWFVEVTDEDGMQQPVHDAHLIYEDMQCLNAGRLFTVQVPDYPGRYVMVLFPFAE